MKHGLNRPVHTTGSQTRRQLLAGAVGLSTAALVAACGGGSGGGGGYDEKPTDSNEKDKSTKDANGLGRMDTLPVGGGLVAHNLVMVHPKKGVVKAYSKQCPHGAHSVSAPDNGVITCATDGARFDIADGTQIGGRDKLSEVAVMVSRGRIYRV